MVRPLDSFCCGCPLSVGVGLILALNLAQLCVGLFTSVMEIVVLRHPSTHDVTFHWTQTMQAGWCLVGLTFVVGGIWGLYRKGEQNLRLYLYYMCVSFGLDVIITVVVFVNGDVCSAIPPLLQKHGAAFACGFMQLVGTFGIVMMMILVTYFICIVWSYCEDLKVGVGIGLSTLKGEEVRNAIDYTKPNFYGSLFGDTSFGDTFSGHGGGPDLGHSNYQLPGLGHTRIFNGWFHETNFPPPARF